MTARGLIFSSLVCLRAVPITGVTPSVPRVSCVNCVSDRRPICIQNHALLNEIK